MAYCAQADIEKRLPEQTLIDLTDDAGEVEVDADVVAAAIADAGEEIDAHIGLRYSLPMASPPAIVTRWSVVLAVCYLYARRDHLDLPSQWDKAQAGVRRQLEAVAKGTLSLGSDDPSGSPSQANAPQMSTDNPTRVFSRDNLNDF